jgi:hypothetical protein
VSVARVPTVQAHDIEDVEEKIRIRAYLLFEKRGGEHGHDLEDWLQAEAEILRSTRSAPPIRLTSVRKTRTRRTTI